MKIPLVIILVLLLVNVSDTKKCKKSGVETDDYAECCKGLEYLNGKCVKCIPKGYECTILTKCCNGTCLKVRNKIVCSGQCSKPGEPCNPYDPGRRGGCCKVFGHTCVPQRKRDHVKHTCLPCTADNHRCIDSTNCCSGNCIPLVGTCAPTTINIAKGSDAV